MGGGCGGTLKIRSTLYAEIKILKFQNPTFEHSKIGNPIKVQEWVTKEAPMNTVLNAYKHWAMKSIRREPSHPSRRHLTRHR